MPELPEVETVRSILAPRLIGLSFTAIKVFWPKTIATGADKMASALPGRRIESLSRRGKFLVFGLAGGLSLVGHLRMEGKLFLFANGTHRPGKFDRVVFSLSDGSELVFADVRKFGRFWLYGKGEKPACLQALGPEATDLSAPYVLAVLKKSTRPVKEVLLDQTRFAGIGNIYADEICFACRINPFYPGRRLATAQIAASIAENAHLILTKAIALHGSSVRTYKASNEISGQYQTCLNVYSRAGNPCRVCQSPIMKRALNGRGTSYCPNCQGVPEVIGITGGIAAGKTTIRKILEQYGYRSLDADSLVKNLYREKPTAAQLRKHFPWLFTAGGEIEKSKVRDMLTAGGRERRKWLGIVYPILRERIEHILDANPDKAFALEAPLLFQARLDTLCNRIIMAITKMPLMHLKKRGDPEPEKALALGNTNNWAKYLPRCRFVIDTDCTTAALETKISESLGLDTKKPKTTTR